MENSHNLRIKYGSKSFRLRHIEKVDENKRTRAVQKTQADDGSVVVQEANVTRFDTSGPTANEGVSYRFYFESSKHATLIADFLGYGCSDSLREEEGCWVITVPQEMGELKLNMYEAIKKDPRNSSTTKYNRKPVLLKKWKFRKRNT